MCLGLSACGAAEVSAPIGPPNVILISIDGMRGDRAHFNGYGRQTTPNLDAFAEAGVRFPHAFSQSNESLLSHAAMFTGRYPTEIARPDYLTYVMPESEQSIAEVMVANGYRTAGFTAAGHVKARYGLHQGFEVFSEGPEFGSFHATVPAALSWLDDADTTEPFFMFLHGYDCHRTYSKAGLFYHPFVDVDPVPDHFELAIRGRRWTEFIYDKVDYSAWFGREDRESLRVHHANGERILDPGLYVRLAAEHGEIPEGHYRILDDEIITHIGAHYDGGVLSADTYLGIFLEGLAARGLWDNTVIIVTSDHGEDLQDHGYSNHRAVLFDSTTRVPFLIGGGAVPDRHRGTVRRDFADAIDVISTVAGMAGIAMPATSRGEDLWSRLEVPSPDLADERSFQLGVMGHAAMRTATHRLVFSGIALTDPEYLKRMTTQPLLGGNFSLYAAGIGEPEDTDILADNGALGENLRREMVAWYKQLDRGDALKIRDPKVLEQLNERGYW